MNIFKVSVLMKPETSDDMLHTNVVLDSDDMDDTDQKLQLLVKAIKNTMLKVAEVKNELVV